MADANPPGSPLETVVDGAGNRTVEVFELLGNETRLAILLALWEAIDPGPPPSEPALSFSDLRERVGIRHGQNFTYHLDKLEGLYISETDEGYTLTRSAQGILRSVLAGTLAGHSSLESASVDETCPECGAPAVLDHQDAYLVLRCPRCEGGAGEGKVMHMPYPPAGLDGRTPETVLRAGQRLTRHRLMSMHSGICPFCAGTTTATLHRCEDHEAGDETTCDRCGLAFPLHALFACDVCKNYMEFHPRGLVYTVTALRRFFYERGVNLHSPQSNPEVGDAFEPVEVTAEDPLAVRLRAELGGDRIDVTLDERARVVDVTRSTV